MKKIIKYLRYTFIICVVVVGSFAVYTLTRPKVIAVTRPAEPTGIEAIKARADFQKRVENEAERVFLVEQKAKIESDYKKASADIEAKLEANRKTELSF